MAAIEPGRIPTTGPPTPTESALRELAATRQREWPGVRITDVTILADVPFTPERHRRVRAHVRLGRLTPADVRVHLTTAIRTADMTPIDAWSRRLTCAQAYDNGHFVFEGHVPEHVLKAMAPRLTVVVEPLSDISGAAPQLEPVVRRVV